MQLSDYRFDLNDYFPFARCDAALRGEALRLGRTVEYAAGENILLSDKRAKHCGLILNGQAVAFKTDNNGRRYQLCLEPGCYIGLETLEENAVYSAKITALTDVIILFWDADGIRTLSAFSDEFIDSLHLMDEGRSYQEQWLVPETDVTDPVLFSVAPHPLWILAHAFIVVPLLLLGLWGCGILYASYKAAMLLALVMCGAALWLLYKDISARSNRRLILTSANLIDVPENDDLELSVTRLSVIQAVTSEQSPLECLLKLGHVGWEDEKHACRSPLLANPDRIAALTHNTASRAGKGRSIPLRVKKPTARLVTDAEAKAEQSVPSPVPKTDSMDSFQTIVLRAHWALLVRLLIKPLIVLLVGFVLFKADPSLEGFGWIFMTAGVLWGLYQYSCWKGNTFLIEENCIKDCCKAPFAEEKINIAMNHKIQSVRFEKKGVFQVMLDYGTVYILAGEGELTFNYVSDPQRVQQLILDTCARWEQKKQLEEESRRRAYIQDLVREIHESENEDQPAFRKTVCTVSSEAIQSLAATEAGAVFEDIRKTYGFDENDMRKGKNTL